MNFRLFVVVVLALVVSSGPAVAAPDSDGDSLSDSKENEIGTDPQNPDTDNDGLTDGEEVNDHLTNPEQADTDGDGINDGAEVKQGTNPTKGNIEADDSRFNFFSPDIIAGLVISIIIGAGFIGIYRHPEKFVKFHQ